MDNKHACDLASVSVFCDSNNQPHLLAPDSFYHSSCSSPCPYPFYTSAGPSPVPRQVGRVGQSLNTWVGEPAQVASLLKSGASWSFPEPSWWLWTKRLPHWLVFTWLGLLPGLCPHPLSCCLVSFCSKWSSRWLLPSQGKKALDRQTGGPWTPNPGVELEREASCCGRSETSPAPPVSSPGTISPGTCPCGAIGLVGSIEEEVAEFL